MKVVLIRGDGIGPEVTDATLQVLEASGAKLEFEEVEAGEEAAEKLGTPLPEEALESIKRHRVVLKGPLTTPVGSGFRSVNVALRQEFDLYACVRPCKAFGGIKTPYPKVDLVVVRENTEDLYVGIEHFIDKQRSAAEAVKLITKRGSERIARFAFEYALREGRKKVTCVHKANILKATDGLFLEVAREVAKSYEGRVEFEDRIVDNMCMQLVRRPQEYDVLLCPNLYGDILSDLCAGLVGGLGVVPSANLNPEEGYAIFEPTHGSAPKYAGKNIANPTAMILAAVMMLKRLGQAEAAQRIENALREVFREGKVLTRDLGGGATTSEFASYLASKLG